MSYGWLHAAHIVSLYVLLLDFALKNRVLEGNQVPMLAASDILARSGPSYIVQVLMSSDDRVSVLLELSLEPNRAIGLFFQNGIRTWIRGVAFAFKRFMFSQQIMIKIKINKNNNIIIIYKAYSTF